MYQAAPQANAGSLSSRYPPLPQSLNPSLSISPFLPPSSLSSPPSASSSISQPGNQIELISLSSCFHDARHIMIYAVPHIALLFCFFVSCYNRQQCNAALAQPIQLGLLVAEEKLFRRHTSSFKGDIKDTKDKKNNKDNIFKLFRRHTLALWRISTFYLFSKTFKYCLLANLSL